MRVVDQRCAAVEVPDSCLRMDFEQRQKRRSRVLATNGEFVGIHLSRADPLKDGDHLRSSDGRVFVVRAKREALSLVEAVSPEHRARVFDLVDRRGVRIQIEGNWIAYRNDEGLDASLSALGMRVIHRDLPFEAEPLEDAEDACQSSTKLRLGDSSSVRTATAS